MTRRSILLALVAILLVAWMFGCQQNSEELMSLKDQNGELKTQISKLEGELKEKDMTIEKLNKKLAAADEGEEVAKGEEVKTKTTTTEKPAQEATGGKREKKKVVR